VSDTKAAWKRRALRAENQLQTMQQIRKADFDFNRAIYSRSAWQAICIQEIREAIARMDEDFPNA